MKSLHSCCRAVAIKFGVVRFVANACVNTLQLGGSGGMLPQKRFWNLEAMILLLRLFWSQYYASRRLDNRVSHVWVSTLSTHCVVQHWFRLSDRSLTSQATPFVDEACETSRSLGRSGSCWKTRKSSFALSTAISQVSTCHLCAWGPCVGGHQAMALLAMQSKS